MSVVDNKTRMGKIGKTIIDSCTSILAGPRCQKYIAANIKDLWKNTPISRYKWMDNNCKGKLGEMMISEMFKQNNHAVKPRESHGHDLIVDDIKTEVKFSVAQTNPKTLTIKPNVFMMNHVSKSKDWQRLVFFGYNPEGHSHVLFWFTKKDFKKILAKTNLFSVQQGGQEGNNDDYVIGAKKLMELYNSEYVKRIEQW